MHFIPRESEFGERVGVRRAFGSSGAVEIFLHPVERRIDVEVQEIVHPLHGRAPVAVHVVEVDIDRLRRGDNLSNLLHTRDHEVGLAEPFSADGFGVHVVGVDDGLVPGEAGRAADDRLRVAVGEDEPRIGKNFK